MRDLVIEVAENGFIVVEGNPREPMVMGKKWAFETPKSLSDFILDWGETK